MTSHASDRYDVVVAGGGLAGTAAAIAAARQGCRVLLGEQRGCLGWEATRGWRIFGDHQRVGLAGELLRDIEGLAGARQGILNPALLEGLLDEKAVEAGVELLFHAWPHELIERDSRTVGAMFATRFGLMPVQAPIVVDATHEGVLLSGVANDVEHVPPRSVHHAVILTGTDLSEPRLIEQGLPERVLQIRMEPIGPTLACATLLIATESSPSTLGARWWAELSSARVLIAALERMRQEPGLKQCEVAQRADEAWVLPSIVVRDVEHDGVLGTGCVCVQHRRQLEQGASLFSTLVTVGEEVGVEAGRRSAGSAASA